MGQDKSPATCVEQLLEMVYLEIQLMHDWLSASPCSACESKVLQSYGFTDPHCKYFSLMGVARLHPCWFRKQLKPVIRRLHRLKKAWGTHDSWYRYWTPTLSLHWPDIRLWNSWFKGPTVSKESLRTNILPAEMHTSKYRCMWRLVAKFKDLSSW